MGYNQEKADELGQKSREQETLGDQLLRERYEDRAAGERDATARHEDLGKYGKADNKGAFAGMAVVTGLAIAAGVIGNKDPKPVHSVKSPQSPIEKVGGYHSGQSTELPSSAHLRQFTQERSVKLNQK